ncbi:SagB family peptide dehydrogenase [Cypionkella sp.]|uniref:SagB family peptide dehydrogenase n=1 Tax=Cypionkella sp. TaxID=2811411 RepID=UPI002758EE16|nr:SagB family peptide dehydrogenase [Cypionkella sp.]
MYLSLCQPPGQHRGPRTKTDPLGVLDEMLASLGMSAPHTAVALADLLRRPVARSQVDALLIAAMQGGEPLAAVVASQVMDQLGELRMLAYATAADETESLFRLAPVAPAPALTATSAKAGVTYRLSRFAQIRMDEAGHVPGQLPHNAGLILESPLSPFRCHINPLSRSTTAMQALALLGSGAALEDLRRADIPEADCEPLLSLLSAAGLIRPLDASGLSDEDQDQTLRQWDVHDLAFHLRSRLGRHDQRIGGDFRFKNIIDPVPALRPEPKHLARLQLARPDEMAMAANDPTLSQTIEARVSVRPGARRPLNLQELGLFLWRTARITRIFDGGIGEFTARPYPSGGGSYEQDVWITAREVVGLMPGFYFYAAATHELLLVRPWNTDCEALIAQAVTAMAETTIPDAVLTLGARFQRVSWKYSGMAYATQLKNTGAIYMAFYMAATAMGLSPCGLGLGSIETFRRLTGSRIEVEGSIGEFALSGPPIGA